MNKLPDSEKVTLQGPAGLLQAVLEIPKDSVLRGCAVICHPHPQHGGTMHNKVAHTLARAFVHRHFAALRFNFRGVEGSDGEFDDGIGELQDALASIDWMRGRWPDLPIWLAGFSFGAAIAIRAAAENQPAGLISVAPAVFRFAGGLERQPECPWLIVQGDNDELVDVDETISWVNALNPGPELQVFEDTEHFFHGKIVKLRDAVETFIENSFDPNAANPT